MITDYKKKWWKNETQKKRDWIERLLILAAMVGMAWFIASAFIDGVVKTQEIEEKKNAPLRQARAEIAKGDHLADAFEKHGSPVPQQMAQACRATRKPKTMAAIAIVESQGTPWAKGKAGERGAWQVIGRHWDGSVPNHPTGQALQAERILDELVASSPRGSLRYALARYNGGDNPPAKSWQYADKVLRIRKTIKGNV